MADTTYQQGDGEVILLRKILTRLNQISGGGGGGGGSGTVIAVGAASLPPLFTTQVVNDPTVNPEIDFALSLTQANKFWLGPLTGADAAPTYRLITATDLLTTLVPQFAGLHIGNAGGISVGGAIGAVQLIGTSITNGAGMQLIRYSTGANSAVAFHLVRANATTVGGSRTAQTINQLLGGTINFFGDDGTNFIECARIYSQATAAWSIGSTPALTAIDCMSAAGVLFQGLLLMPDGSGQIKGGVALWDASQNLVIARFNGGVNADATHFWCGDNTWKVPSGGGGGSGDVVGPAGATDGHIAIFDGATGKLLKDSGAVALSGVATSGGAGDAGKVPLLNASGVLDSSFIVGGGGGDRLSNLTTAEVSITGATSLAGTDYGKAFVCSGSSAYTVNLPTSGGTAGKSHLSVRVATAANALITFDAGSGGTIDGQRTRVMQLGECADLRLVGTKTWTKVGGKSIPLFVSATTSAIFAIAAVTPTKCPIDTFIDDDAGLFVSASNWILIPRPGVYEFRTEFVGPDNDGAINQYSAAAGTTTGASVAGGSARWQNVNPSVAIGTSRNHLINTQVISNVAAGDTYFASYYWENTSSPGNATSASLTMVEIPAW